MSLNRILTLDALTCAAMGLLLLLATPALSAALSLPQALLFWAGVILMPTALFMAALGLMARPAGAAVWLVVLGNAGWVLASLVAIFATAPNGLGIAFVLLQALVVLWLTAAEYRSLTRREMGHYSRTA